MTTKSMKTAICLGLILVGLTTVSGQFIASCQSQCSTNQCQTGCSLWDNSTLIEGCSQSCNEEFTTETYKVQYCERGCNFSEAQYAQAIIDAGSQTAPELAGLPNSTSIPIEWAGSTSSEVYYVVQWRYSERELVTWTTFSSTSNTQLIVTGLYPFTNYKFRVQWVVISPSYTAFTDESVTIQTLADGPPLDAPIITSLISPSPTTVLVEWLPVFFPAGDITSYELAIQSSEVVRVSVTDPTRQTHLFIGLQPSTVYNVSVAARNVDGTGPANWRVTTTQSVFLDNVTVPYLVFGVERQADHSLQLISAVDSLPVPFGDMTPNRALHVIKDSSRQILDVAVHYAQDYLFFTDESGTIHRKDISDKTTAVNETDTEQIIVGSSATKLAVDWLYNEIYFVNNQTTSIMKCALDGTNLADAVGSLSREPLEISVDPFNGYLFWSDSNGIQRLDLADVGSNAATHFQTILSIPATRAFIVDPNAYRIFYANTSDDSVGGAQLDGTDPSVARQSNPDNANMLGLQRYDGLFFWQQAIDPLPASCPGFDMNISVSMWFEQRNGDDVVDAQYIYLLCPHGFGGLDILHPSSQPSPVPVFAPDNLQVLFDVTSAMLSWDPLRPLESKGRGAWQEWTYQVNVTEVGSYNPVPLSDVENGMTSLEVPGLTVDTEYTFRVRATSPAGNGPWSEPFTGKTFIDTSPPAYILMATNGETSNSIVKTAIDGSDAQILCQTDNTVKDLTWEEGFAFWIDDNGKDMYGLNLETEGSQPLLLTGHNSPLLQALAVDWIGMKMYWSDSDLNQIQRADIDLSMFSLSNMEPVQSFAPARDIAIDSVNGYIYWSEASRLEGARLNGNDVAVIDVHDELADEEVAGLTLDFVGEKVYWFVISSNAGDFELQLHSAAFLTPSSSSQSSLVQIVESSTMQATLHIYSGKFFWVDMSNMLSVGEAAGGKLATVPSEPISEVTVIQTTTLQPFPAGFSEVPNVRPDDISRISIMIDGTWDNFTVTWRASTEVQHGDVFYEVGIDETGGDYSYAMIQQVNYVMIDELEPYSLLGVSVSAFTYWATSEPATATLRSPMSVPSVPTEPRLFVMEDYDVIRGMSEFTAIFRWEEEERTNGVLEGYHVIWGTSQPNSEVTEDIPPNILEFQLRLSDTSEEYSFRVAGYTEIGDGDYTSPLTASAQNPNPPPSFLTRTMNGFAIVDEDTGDVISDGPENADVALYHYDTQTWYYFYDNDLKMLDSQGITRDLITVTETPAQNAFTLDWITLTLYWAVGDDIFLHDTNREADHRQIDTGNGMIGGLVVSPYENFLIWSDQDGVLWSYNLTGATPNLVRSMEKRQADDNCEVIIEGAFTLDVSVAGSSMLYYYDKATKSIWMSESHGCNPTQLFDATSQAETALPASSMTVDQTRLYWINGTRLASVDKLSGSDFRIEDTQAKVLIATGSHLQPYPDPSCLIPADPVKAPSLAEAFKDRLELVLQAVGTAPSCGPVSLATPIYTVYYQIEGEDGNCTEEFVEYEETVNLEVQLSQLQSYTNYCMFVEASNMYNDQNVANLTSVTSDFITHRTWVGVPSAPRDVTIEPLTPYELKVSWLPPLELNGPPESLVYELSGFQGQENLPGNSAVISGREPATNYMTKVLVRHSNAKDEQQEESDEASGRTFEEPAPITRGKVTYYSIEVCWNTSASIQRYQLQYRFYSSDINNDPKEDFMDAPEMEADQGSVQQCQTVGTLDNQLRPYSLYYFQQSSQYISGRWLSSDEIPGYEILEVLTKGDVPGDVGPPKVADNVVSWEAPDPRGPGDLTYTLQAKLSGTTKRDLEEWTTVYVGEGTSWAINLTANRMYSFRVAASNSIGMGSFSLDSEPFTVIPEPSDNLGLIIGVAVGVAAVVIIALIIILFCFMRNKEKDKNQNFGGPVTYQTDTELATLRDYPTHMEGNQLYALTTTADGKDVKLPLFARERLKLVTFLGSGAFGEVFEGVALNILTPTSGKTKVAVKTLKKGSTDEEKADFLKEAMLMSNFHHANIMGLLGVCLDNDPQYLILELMEGGDLLTYLRGARGTQEKDPKLTEADLVDIVTDVARGCKYLEEMHFVHRDLAARNCLVSCQGYEDSKCRITKIGDFGLARDIYKSDYYRKEGEGLLPVRWMSPEALIDGLFTNASDIWAFGVLVWEVFTFGQQPYPARTNIEVLKFVTEGGRLERPEKCPDDMYSLMSKCWEKNARSRPSFLIILDRCELYRRKSFGPGFDNEAFLEDKINYSKVNQNLDSDDYLEPMEKPNTSMKQKPPNLQINSGSESPPVVEKKREGSFRRLMGAIGGSPPQSPQPMLEAAAKEQTWQKNKPSINERYLQMPVGRSASSVQPGTKPAVSISASVARGESVNIPAGSTPRKRQAPKSPLTKLADMPERPAPSRPAPAGPPPPSEQHSRTSSHSSVSRPTGSRASSQSSVSRPAGTPPVRPSNKPQAPPRGGAGQTNPFRQYSQEGEEGKINVEFYNV